MCTHPQRKNKINEEQKTRCQHYLGYLYQKLKSNPIPPSCIECKQVLECMLNKDVSSTIWHIKPLRPLETPHSKIFNAVWNLAKKGCSQSTVKGYSKKLKLLSKFVNLDDPEGVNNFLANNQNWKNTYKQIVGSAYLHYARFYNLDWKKPKFKDTERLAYVPSTEQVSMIIAASDRKYSLIFSILCDTGLHPVELNHLTLKNVDLENGIIYPDSAKHEKGRTLKLKSSTSAMLREYVSWNKFGLNEKLFPSTTIMSRNFVRIRNRLAERLCKPQLKKLRLLDLRNYYVARSNCPQSEI